MAWETRKGRLYYYSKERRGGKVVSVYHGAGMLAGEIADWMEDKAFLAKLERANREDFDEIELVVSEQFELCRVILSEHLVAAGYHEHKGEWRRKRGINAC